MKALSFLTTMLFACSIAFSQEIIAIYSYKPHPPDMEEFPAEMREWATRFFQETAYQYKLAYCSGNSLYEDYKTIYPEDAQPTSTFVTYAEKIYCTENRIIFENEAILGTHRIVDENKEDLIDWQLLNRDTLIREMSCKLAMNRHNHGLVWYAPQIPISTGPSIYSGLPGIIVYVEDNKGTIILESILKITEDDHSCSIPIDFTGRKTIGYEQYIQMKG